MAEKKKNKEKPAVSVIIPSYNAEKHIEECLNSLQRPASPLNYEIIVVDSSTDATPAIIKTKFPEVRLIHLDRQTYPGAGRNTGVQQARGNIIAFIDSDCIATEDWLERGVEALDNGYAIIGGSVHNANPGWISWADYFLTFNEFMPTMPRKEVQFMPTCNLFISPDTFQKVGGFREDLLAGEDTLFCSRASQNYRLLFEPQLQVKHNNRETWKNFITHHISFGKHSAQVRKQADLPGAALVKNPFLALGAPFARTARIGWRMLRHNTRYVPRFTVSLPLLWCGTLAWSYGFMKEAWKK